MVKKLNLNESDDWADGVVNLTVPHLFEYDQADLGRLVDWCNDYLSQYGLDAYVQTTRTYNNELSVFYEIEDLDTTTHREVNDTISQAVGDFFSDNTNESYLNEDSIDDVLSDRTYVIPDIPQDYIYDTIEYGKSIGLKQNQFSYDSDAEELVITYSGYDRTGYEKCVRVRNWLLNFMEEEGYQYDECKECVGAKTTYEENITDEYTGSYTMDLSKQYNDRVIDGFVDYVCDYVEDADYIGIYIYDTQYDKAALKLTFLFESDNNMPITNLDDIYDVFDTAVEYAVEDGMLISYMDNSITESGDWRTNPNRLNDVEEVFVNDIFADKRGNKVKVLKVNKDDFTIKNINTGVVSRIRKDYLINRFELTDDFAECFPCKTSYVNEKISDKDYSQSKKGIAYKVFEFKNGKLYPPMVANAGDAATPTGVWLDAEPGEFVELDGLQRVVQRGVKGDKLKQRIANLDTLGPEERKKEVEKIKHSTLAYRPGWHLGDIPRAPQFDRHATWKLLDELPEGVEISGNLSSTDTLAPKATKTNIGKYFYIKNLKKYAYIYADGDAKYFPYNFVWAECEYVADIDYQDEAMSYGYRKGNKFQHSLAGLPKVPEGGSYKYRTNPRPDTVPWVITGAIRINKLLDDYDVQQILGSNAPERQGGDKTLAEIGLKQI